jgi:hypothetical protein
MLIEVATPPKFFGTLLTNIWVSNSMIPEQVYIYCLFYLKFFTTFRARIWMNLEQYHMKQCKQDVHLELENWQSQEGPRCVVVSTDIL